MNSQTRPVILILEDNTAMCVYYRDILMPRGYEVMCSANFGGALRLFKEERSHVVGIISDGNVVDGDLGPIFVESVRRLGFTGPIVAASMSDSLVEKLVKAGCDLKVREKSDAPEVLHRAILAAKTRPT